MKKFTRNPGLNKIRKIFVKRLAKISGKVVVSKKCTVLIKNESVSSARSVHFGGGPVWVEASFARFTHTGAHQDRLF